jgi:CRISPR/Cas system-associated endoribonuclease Cas2
MSRSKSFVVLAVTTAVAALAVSTAASAHGGRGGGGALGRIGAGALVTAAAQQLDVTRARLVAAIEAAAVARVDEAVEDGDVEAEDAAALKTRAQANLRVAMDLSRTRVVAANLDITTARLNTAFRAARRAIILARINEAVSDGDLEEADAAELRAELAAATLPGYKAAALRGLGVGCGRGGR